MECPFCYTNFEYHLSICTSCGKDTDDPVYQELFSRVKPRKIESEKPSPMVIGSLSDLIEEIAPVTPPAAYEDLTQKPVAVTAEIRTKNTCKTLMDFPGVKPEIPEWRKELKSRIKDIQTQRSAAVEIEAQPVAINATRHAIGGTGLAMALIETPAVAVAQSSPLVEKALARIERSRRKIAPEPQETATAYQPHNSYQRLTPEPAAPVISRPRSIVASEPAPVPVLKFEAKPETKIENKARPFVYSENETVESRLPVIEQNFRERLAHAIEVKNDLMASGEQFTTSKLRMPKAINIRDYIDAAEFEEEEVPARTAVTRSAEKTKAVEIEAPLKLESDGDEETAEEIAPFVYRFNAGFFDLIISGFLSLLLLTPFIMLNGKWYSVEGALAFLATCSIVMFLYITASIGLIGRTLGMGLFSLEMIDAEDNDYPTFNQAAVSSSIYLASLALGGLGFATMFWNDERRAFHDLMSGTVVVREI
jgi:uncharacterized RDD family membrane protein YckC